MESQRRCCQPRYSVGYIGGFLAPFVVQTRIVSGTVMSHAGAGMPAPPSSLIDVGRLEQAFLERTPDLSDARQLVSFGTSGHRGTPLNNTLTRAHVLAIAQAICDYRHTQG